MSDGMQLRAYEKGQLITRLRKQVKLDVKLPEMFIVESGHAVSSTSGLGARRYAPADVFGLPMGIPNRGSECDVIAGESPTVCAVLNAQAMQIMLADWND